MKITEDEREAAYELRYHIEGILFERERAALYREIYTHMVHRGVPHDDADRNARMAIRNMEKAFEPICEHCEAENDAAAQAKAN